MTQQQRKSVAYLGPISSYSHQAALDCFDPKEYIFEPQVTIQDIFEAVQSSAVTRGVIPFENSTNGSVVYTLDLLCDRLGAYPDVNVCGEAYLNVQHNLLGRSPVSLASAASASAASASASASAPGSPHSPRHRRQQSSPHSASPTQHAFTAARPLSSLAHIQRIYSHPQAFGQCEIFLTQYLKNAERHEVSSTSKAAEIVSLDETRSSAAISSAIAADVHGLEFLARGIEDREDNTTRFFIIQKGSAGKESQTMGTLNEHCHEEAAAGTRKHKSLVSFTIDHLAPGALADALMVLKSHGLNLTSINSRPSRELPWHYIFFVEFEGSRWDDPDGAVGGALKDLGGKASEWRWLGSWLNELKR